MRKKNLLPVSVVFSLILLSGTASGLEVTVSDRCSTDEAAFLSLNDTEGGHAAEPFYYDNKVCVEGVESFEMRENCENDEKSALGLFRENNSHVSTYDDEYLIHSCARNINTHYDRSCNENETKILSLAKKNNSHAAAPSHTDSIYNGSLCGSYEQPENVTLSLSGLSSPVQTANEETVSTGETVYPPQSYPYIASENTGMVNYGNFLKLSRPEIGTVSMTQEGSGNFIVPIFEDISSIEDREDEVTERRLLDLTSPNFGYTIPENPTVKVIYRSNQNIETSTSEFATRGSIKIENRGIKGNDLTVRLEN